jgi:hypothetical protein
VAGAALDHLVERRFKAVQEPGGGPFDRLLADGQPDPEKEVAILVILHLDVAADAVVDRAGDPAARAGGEREAALHPRRPIRAPGGAHELVARVLLEGRELLDEGAGHLTGEVAARVVPQHPADDVDHLMSRAVPQLCGEILPLLLQMRLPRPALGLELRADVVLEPGAEGGGLLPCLAQHLVPAQVQRLLLFAHGARLGLGRFARRAGLRQAGFDPLLAPRHGACDGAVEKALQKPDEDEKVDDLRDDRQPVDLHGLILLRPERRFRRPCS